MKVVLLSGSPKGKVSTSFSLVNYVSNELERNGLQTVVHILSNSIRSEESMNRLLTDLDSADYIVLAAPLYIDTLPAHVLQTMLDIDRHRSGVDGRKSRFIGILNSGFPESEHNSLALDILRNFCLKIGYQWAGGIPFGGGGIIGGVPLDETGGRGRNAKLSMDLLVSAIMNMEDVPTAAIGQIKKQVVPKRLYIMMAQRGWKQLAKANGVDAVLDAKPYCS
ncbi:MAG: NAD(P)H-dependent oxidoreductase [Candidatus Thorarchaeota archaeon]